MDEEIKLIGERLKGLREVLEITAEEMAETYGCDVDKYMAVESGNAEPSVSALSKVAKKYDVELDVLMFGEEPHMRHYFLTRKGQGKSIERRKEYNTRVWQADSAAVTSTHSSRRLTRCQAMQSMRRTRTAVMSSCI